jgi:hypothetical protein
LLLGYNPWISGTRLKAPALTGFGPHRRLTRGGPVKPALFAPRPPIEGVLVLLDAQPVERAVGLLLLPDVLRDRGLVQADDLTTTEFTMAMLACRGWTNAEIAR